MAEILPFTPSTFDPEASLHYELIDQKVSHLDLAVDGKATN